MQHKILCSVELVASQFEMPSTRPLFLYTDPLKTTELYWKLQFIPCSKPSLGYKNQNQLILYKDVIYFYSEIHTKQVNTLWERGPVAQLV